MQYLIVGAAIVMSLYLSQSFSVGSAVNQNFSQDTIHKPNTVLEYAEVPRMHVLVVKDTVPLNRLHDAFGKGYGELFAFCSRQQLKTGKVMAFYSGYTDPLVVEIGVEVQDLPDSFPGRIKAKTVEGGFAIIAHYRGAYSRLHIPYEAIERWMIENNKQPRATPFEVYNRQHEPCNRRLPDDIFVGSI